MTVSLPCFQQQLKLFLKSRLLFLLYIIMWISALVGIGFFLIVPSWIFFTLSTITRFVFYESLLFALITYIFLAKATKNHVNETISSMTHSKQFYMLSSVFVLLFLLILFNLFIFILLLINTIKTGEYEMFLTLLKKEYLLNILLPQLTSFLIVTSLSQIQNRTISSVIFTAVIILMSPYMDLLEWRTQPSLPVDQLVNIIHLPFAFFMQHSNWSVDLLYGLQNELYKICAMIFWIFFSLIILYRQFLFKHKKIGFIMLIINAILLISVYLPQSMLRLDTKWNGCLSDQNYYHMMDGKTIYNNEKVDYHIEKYDMNIQIKRQLYVDGQFTLASNQKRKDFVLTLYHQFKISDLTCDKDFSYKREGDFLYLNFNEEINQAILSFSYEGYHNLLYSNYQAANLPGYFPWYPMAGEKETYFQNGNIRTVSYGLNVYNRVEDALFEVSIDANYPIASNLKKKDNKYIGTSDSLTVIGGNIGFPNQEEYNISNYLLYDISAYHSLDNRLSDIEEDIKTTEDAFQSLFGLELNHFKNKKIMICPKSVSQTQVTGGYAEFNDYILIADSRLAIFEFSQYHLINRFDIDSTLIDVLLASNDLYSETQEEYMNTILNTINGNIQDLTMFQGDLEEELDQQIKQYTKLNDYLTKRIDKVGLEQVMKELGQLILGEHYEY